MKCRVCSDESPLWGRARILGRHDVAYYRCTTCGFIQTEEPYWLAEAYREAITALDTGYIDRNLRMGQSARLFLKHLLRLPGPYLDYGGGYGMFARLMRDRGFEFFSYDPYCANLFARECAVTEPPVQRFSVATAFEVFEHWVEPAREFAKLLTFADNLIVSTELLRGPISKPSDWWYFGLGHGQHVSLFTEAALRRLGAAHGLHLMTDRKRLHLFSRRRLSRLRFWFFTRKEIRLTLGSLARGPWEEPAPNHN